MLGMHGDMQGSAVALALFLLLEEENFPFDIELSLAIAENKIGPGAYKPNDVVRASNGMSIEIIDTDAEGRMVLADTLALVSSSNPKPDLIIEFSTLTGACVRALGTSYTGIYTNRLSWRDDLIDAGVQSGERVWVFPNDDDFGEALKSPVADIKQCSPDAGPDHILAGHFLKQFVNDIPFIHVDLSASENESGVGPSPGPVSGMGVRFARAFLETWRARNCNDPR
jgi:leucyl aminopeptidase